MANDNVFNYGTKIHERPEFLMTLGELFPQQKKLKVFGEQNQRVTELISMRPLTKFTDSILNWMSIETLLTRIGLTLMTI